MDRQAARTCKQVNIDIPVTLSLSHLSCSGCIVVHVLEDGDVAILTGR